MYMLLLPEGQTGEAWEPLEKQSSSSVPFTPHEELPSVAISSHPFDLIP
jgi:hypothetical protein